MEHGLNDAFAQESGNTSNRNQTIKWKDYGRSFGSFLPFPKQTNAAISCLPCKTCRFRTPTSGCLRCLLSEIRQSLWRPGTKNQDAFPGPKFVICISKCTFFGPAPRPQVSLQLGCVSSKPRRTHILECFECFPFRGSGSGNTIRMEMVFGQQLT